MRIILVKLTFHVTEKCQKKNEIKINKNFTVSFSGKTPLKLEQMPQKFKQFPFRACCKHSQPLLVIGLLLRFYNYVQTNGTCVDPDQTDS